MQSNQHVLQTLTLAIILVQISWTLNKLSVIWTFRCKHLADPKHPKLTQNFLTIPSNYHELFNLTRGEETLRLGGEDMSAHVPL